MAGQIRMTPEQMCGRAGEVRTEGQNFQDVVNKMQSIINVLQDEREGQASAQFAQQFETPKPAFNSMKQLLDDIGSQLDGTANAVEQLDQDIASKFRN
ncbi:MAG: WXG100 family type VII secretion target [Christensenellaceae bacterium]|nr:WXG100 family type VII secretion target [Christensenellaceae bacterium]